MPSGLSAGKRKGLEAVANSRGIIAALAIDQRSALRSLFSRAMGIEPENVPRENLSQFKQVVSEILTPHASAILLDPEYGLPAAAKRAKSAGLLLAYEQTGYDKKVPGRMPRLLDGWSVKRLIEEDANAVKLLLYYSNRSTAETNGIKHALVEKVGAECGAADVPFFLELVSYAENMDEKGIEFARIKLGVGAGAITLGSAGLIWHSATGDTLFANAPRLAARSCVGSGDSTLAGFAFAAQQGLSPIEAVRLAAACGSANCIAPGPGGARAEDIASLRDQIRVEILA